MHTFKFFINYTKEEKWLNKMAKKGYELDNVCFGYRFHKVEPSDITYRIDYRQFKSKRDFVDYCTLFEDAGWKHITGSRSSGAQYFKKISDESTDDIFSDNSSKAGRYKRASEAWLSFALCYFTITICGINNGTISLKTLMNPKLLYYTPGLWSRTGFDFIFSFLFETPFALGRALIWLLCPICIVVYIYLVIKYNRLGKESIK